MQPFGVPTSMFLNVAIEARSVLVRDVSELFEELGKAKLFAERVASLDRFLLTAISHVNRLMTFTAL
jgi:hypothetical protein